MGCKGYDMCNCDGSCLDGFSRVLQWAKENPAKLKAIWREEFDQSAFAAKKQLASKKPSVALRKVFDLALELKNKTKKTHSDEKR